MNRKQQLSDQLDWIYKLMGKKWDQVEPITNIDDETKLYLAHLFVAGTGTNKGKWLLDWKWLGINSTQASAEWKARALAIDNTKFPRARAVKPMPELFDTLEDGWYNFDKSDHENIDAIFVERGKIVSRSAIAEIRKSVKSIKTISESDGSVDYSDMLKPLKALVKNLPHEACLVFQDWLARSNNNKVAKVLEFKNIPDNIKARAVRVANTIKNDSEVNTRTIDQAHFAELCMAGLTPCYFEKVFDKQGDLVYLRPSEYISIDDLTHPDISNDTHITLGAASAIPLARISQLEANTIKLGGHSLTKSTLNVVTVSGEHTMTKLSLFNLLVVNWNAHADTWKEWLNNPSNFKKYHLYRKSTLDPWAFNLPAICISILEDTGFYLNPLTIELVLNRKPEALEGSPIKQPGSIVRIINDN